MASRRRAYPQPQFDQQQPQQPQVQPQFQQPIPSQQFVTPDQLANNVANMNINNGNQFQQPIPQQQQQIPQQQQYMAYPSYQQPIDPTPAPYNVLGNQDTSVDFNKLYSTDLLKDLPPPITDLSFPPPPITLPLPNPELMASTDYFRASLNVVPKTSSVYKKSKLPFNLVVRPYTGLTDEEEIFPISEDTSIIRCRRCRAYLNPFVELKNNNSKWRCNMCMLLNDIPKIGEITARGEMNNLHYEFRAPSEYAARPPEALTYVFILDVSQTSIQSGLLATAIQTILDSLDLLPNDEGRANLSFIGVDSQLYYFGIPEDGDTTQDISMMVVGTNATVTQPAADGLVANLLSCRSNIEKLLSKLPSFFQGNINNNFDLAAGLTAGFKLIQSLGGKMTVISGTLPNIGEGKLTSRDESSVAGTPKESQKLLTPNNSFYRSFAVDCNKNQVSVDMFLASSSYQDVATLSQLPKFTSGQTHFYPAWSATSIESITKLTKELSKYISSEIGLEAVLRVRASDAISTKAYYGNFFSRASDLMAFPAFPRDQAYVVELAVEEDIKRPIVYFQAAILHTSVHGGRRVRVFNMALPTSDNVQNVYASADQLSMITLLARKAVDKAFGSSLEASRDLLDKAMIDILNVYKKEINPGNIGSSSPLQLCTNLRMLPLLTQSLMKHIGIRGGKVPSDHRSAALNKLYTMPIDELIQYIYPTIYSLHDMPDDAGLPFVGTAEGEEEEEFHFPPRKVGEIVLPERVNASGISLERYGLYLINNGSEIFLYVGGDAVPQLLNDIFGVEDIFQVPCEKCELPELDNEFNERVRNIIGKIRERDGSISYESMYVIIGPSSVDGSLMKARPEIGSMRMWGLSTLVEDRSSDQMAFKDQLGSMRDKLT